MIHRVATYVFILMLSLVLLPDHAAADYDLEQLRKEIGQKQNKIKKYELELEKLPREIAVLTKYTDPSVVLMEIWNRDLHPSRHLVPMQRDEFEEWVSTLALFHEIYRGVSDIDLDSVIAELLRRSDEAKPRLRQAIEQKKQEIHIARSRILGLRKETAYLRARVAELEAAGEATATADITEWDFGIVSASYPRTIVSNAKRQNLIVTYTGAPEFPVEMIMRPVSCPAEYTCGTETRNFFVAPKGKVSLVGRQHDLLLRHMEDVADGL